MFHIISLQRTASKALSRMLHSSLKHRTNYLSMIDGSQLGEYLHDWGRVDFQFHPDLEKPFGHNEDVVYYKTHPKFGDPTNVVFETQFDSLEGKFIWLKRELYHARSEPDVRHELEKLSVALFTTGTRPFVLKTQLADINARSVRQPQIVLGEFHNKHNIVVIHLTRSDPLSWVCSMLLTSASGQFVANDTQRNAVKKFQDEKISWTKDEVSKLGVVWNQHAWIKERFCPDFSVNEKTLHELPHKLRMLSSLERQAAIDALTHIKEFSSVPYQDMIQDYPGLMRVVKSYFQ